MSFKKANLTMTIPEEDDDKHLEACRKDVRTRLFKETGLSLFNDDRAAPVSTTSVQSAKKIIMGDHSTSSLKQREGSNSGGLKINLIMLDGEELAIHIHDIDEDPLFAIMAFAVEHHINDLALIEILRRKTQREIARMKGNYQKRVAAMDNKKSPMAGDTTPAMSTSTIQSIYKQGCEDSAAAIDFSRKTSVATNIPRPVTPKGAPQAKTPKSNSSANFVFQGNQISSLMTMFESKQRKVDSGQGGVKVVINSSQKQTKPNSRGSPLLKKNPQPAEHRVGSPQEPGEKNIPGKPLGSPDSPPLQKTKDNVSNAASHKLEQVGQERLNPAGIPEISYKIDLKKSGNVFKDIAATVKAPIKDTWTVMAKIFSILDSDQDGFLSRTAIDMGALMDVSIDLLDALQDVIGDVFESDDPIDLEVFSEMVSDKCDMKRLTDVYSKCKL